MIVAVALAVTLAATSSGNTFNLTGLWESAETSVGGIGQAIEFREDGTFTEATIVLVEMPYRLDGNRLLLGKENEKGGVFTAAFEGTTLVETEPDGTVVRKDRLPGQPAGPSPIVGAWRYCHYTGVIAYERYTEAGSMQLRLPMRLVTGRYSVQGNALTLTFPDGPDVPITLEAQGENLAMSRSRGTTEYHRAGDRAWYGIGSVEKCNAIVPGTVAPTPAESKALPQGPVKSHPPIEQFLGLWRNVDPEKGGWTRVEIGAKGDELRIMLWGKCHPSDCELGPATARYKGSPIVLSSNEGFVKRRFTLWLEDDTLRMTTSNHFTDRSGRPDYVSEARFRK